MTTPVQTGFVRTDDGYELYRRMHGDHGPVLACCNGVGVSTFFWKYVALGFAKDCRVVLWDYRGHGLSSVPPDLSTADLTMPRLARDLSLVLEDLGLADEPVILLGHSMGCQVILEFHRQFPERVQALVPMFGTAGKALDTFLDFPRSRQVFQLLSAAAAPLGRSSFRFLLPLYASPWAYAVGQLTGFIDRYDAGRVDIQHYMEHLEHMDPRIFLAMVRAMDAHDLWDHLPEIAVPTLVFGGENDLFTPLRLSEEMAAAIPDAELTILAEGSHAAIVEQPETIHLRIARFLQERLGLDLEDRPPPLPGPPAASR